MKKQYMQPSVEEIKITTTALLAGSDISTSNNEPDKWGSRGGRWEDEEEEEW